jgi:glycine/D-amino acid oxidase-like deaminating enzyme
MELDYLIIGQGLAGSLLAWELIKRNKKVQVIDNGADNASKTAAGLINPITGIRWVKTPHFDDYIKSASYVYRQLEQQFKQAFWVEMPMLRLIHTQQELKRCQARRSHPDYQQFISALLPPDPYFPNAIALARIHHSGYVKTEPLLAALKDFFIEHNSYQQSVFDPGELHLKPQLRWQNFHPRRIVFCEGHMGRFNPWFSFLPFQPAKGEILTAQTSQSLPNTLLNYGRWLIPLDKHHFKTGASFDPDLLDTTPSESARHDILRDLQATCPALKNPTLLKHQAGIRPTTLDKRPFIGCHPQYPELIIFNGFGAKGSLQIPEASLLLCDFLEGKQHLPAEWNILRYTCSSV